MKNTVLVILSVIISALLFMGCGQDKTPEVKPQVVKTQVVGSGNQQLEGTYTGVVRGRYETNLSFQVGGKVLNRNVQLGDRVTAGQVLMTIDARDVVEKSNQGDAQVVAAKAQLDLAQSNLNRYKQLYAQDAVPASVLDQYQTAYDAALAQYNQAVAGAAQGHNALDYTALTAPMSGVISAINAESGQVVGAGQPVISLVQSNEYEVEINLPENHLEDVPLGKSVQITFWAIKNAKVEGVIREVSPVADGVSRTYKVRVSIKNPPKGMYLGMTANVKCTEADRGELGELLPISAIYQTGRQAQVWVVDKGDNTVHLKNITFDNTGNNSVRVKGLSLGDIVVIAGVHKLHERQKVRLTEDE
ncbi:MAG: efflux RND transporter periplasmic adaptor subunit [Anaerovibrio sp.]|uniref:efflux RND transporter periplasmic adaptor subunit n=1 Tax=Anaerovibrio sp. TaxID=1872532 RepID=UPI0025BF5076|nr:efflux RND transporter periplasmic adaptor subunit [Anaerovibrio sp.]MBE6098933.1 efflux RND transporter periplasmic adaptor subunit [Anaerovibrio sp.]